MIFIFHYRSRSLFGCFVKVAPAYCQFEKAYRLIHGPEKQNLSTLLGGFRFRGCLSRVTVTLL